jgi:hypothetical protein
MAFIIKDRVKEITTSTGTGAISLGGASSTFDQFQTYMSNGDTTYYAIASEESGVDEWEVGIGTWNTGNTLTRTTILAGSNSTSAVNFTAGDKQIFMTYPAAKAAFFNANGDLDLTRDPQTALQAATKQYVDTIAAAGIHYHDPVRVEQEGNLTATYDNGTSGVGATLTNNGTQAALSIDGVTLSLNDRVLIYEQTNAYENGIYTVTDTGSASTNWVLTRATDADSYGASDPDALGQGDAFFVQEGGAGAGELYVMNTEGAITFGTTAITFTQVAATAVYTAGDGLSLTGTEFAVGAGTGVTVGSNSVSIGQAVSTSDTPTFAGLTSTANISLGDDDKVLLGASNDLEIYHEGATGDSHIVNNGSGDLKVSSNLSFGDNDKAIFGAGSDLRIYHDGATGNSYIWEQGTGGELWILGTDIRFANTSFSSNYARFVDGGEVELYYGNQVKLETTSTGIDVTGTVTADGLTVDTNTLHVDATNNWVGIGTSSPASLLHLDQGSGGNGLRFERDSYDTMDIELSESGLRIRNETDCRTDVLIDGSGNVGIGTASPAQELHVSGGSATRVDIQVTTNATGHTAGDGAQFGYIDGVGSYIWNFENSDTYFAANNTRSLTLVSGGYALFERSGKSLYVNANYSGLNTFAQIAPPNTDGMDLSLAAQDTREEDIYIKSSTGYVGMGTTSPSSKLNVYSGTDPAIIAASDDWGEQLEVHRANSSVNWPSVKFTNTSGELGRVFVDASNDYLMYVKAGGSNYETVWTNYTDGSGSGLDADTLDGVEGSSYLRSDADDTTTGKLTISGSGSIAGTTISNGYLQITDGSATLAFDSNEIVGNANTYIRSVSGTTLILGTGTDPQITINSTGIRIGDQGNGYIRPVSGNYGSIEIDGGAHGGYEGYSIGGVAVFMTNSSTYAGLYNDANNHWFMRGTFNGSTEIHYQGTSKLQTTSSGINVTGALTATTKSFVIDHPTKEGMRLRHGSLEGPEDGVYVRGRLTGETVIELPDYWTGLVHEDSITVQLTAMGGKADLWVESIADNKVTVGCDTEVDCFYFVQATRKDVDAWDVEYEA